MKVLVFTSLYPNNIWPSHGVFIKERITQVAKIDGCEVKVVAPVPYFPPVKFNWRWQFSQVVPTEVRDGIEVFHPRYYMIPKWGMALYGVLMFFSVVLAVRKVQRDFDFDLIDSHYVYPDGFAAVLLGKYFNKPVVVSARGSDINLFAEFRIIRCLLRFTLRKADRIIAVCMALKQAMIDLGVAADKITVVPNGVDVKKFYRISKDEARKKLGLPTDGKIVLSVGWLIPRKGFDLIIKALKILSQQNEFQNLSLVIAGVGPSKNELVRLAGAFKLAQRVRFVGSVPHGELFSWYSAADVFCLASIREGWPNVILESLACGTPAVAVNIWGVPEIIRSEKVGVLTKRSEADIAKGISVALNNPWQVDEIIQFAREHTWEHAAFAVHDVFRSVLDVKGLVPGEFISDNCRRV